MGSSSSFAALGRKFDAAAVVVGADTTPATVKAAQVMKSSIAGFLGGPSKRLRGVGNAGAMIGPRYAIAQAGSAHCLALVGMYGPAHLYERDMPAHPVGVRETRARAGGEVYMRVPHGRGWATGPWIAGGSTGKHPFEKGTNAVLPVVPRIYQAETHAALARIF
jgi:hypothetical protein